MRALGRYAARQGEEDVPWPCDPDRKYIVHFPETREIWSYGSGYGGNALLGEEVLRSAHRLGDGPRRRLAGRAHADPQADQPRGRGPLHGGGLPERVRQDQPGHGRADIPGWKAETIGDDICWMKFGPDGRLRAINPEFGMFGVAPGTGPTPIPMPRRARTRHDLHQRGRSPTTATSGGRG